MATSVFYDGSLGNYLFVNKSIVVYNWPQPHLGESIGGIEVMHYICFCVGDLIVMNMIPLNIVLV